MLDVEARRRAIDAFTALRQQTGITLVVAAHDLALLESVCDRALLVQAGRVTAAGPVPLIVQQLLSSLKRPEPHRRPTGEVED